MLVRLGTVLPIQLTCASLPFTAFHIHLLPVVFPLTLYMTVSLLQGHVRHLLLYFCWFCHALRLWLGFSGIVTLG